MPYDVEVTLTVEATNQDEAWSRVQDFLFDTLPNVDGMTLYSVEEPIFVFSRGREK